MWSLVVKLIMSIIISAGILFTFNFFGFAFYFMFLYGFLGLPNFFIISCVNCILGIVFTGISYLASDFLY